MISYKLVKVIINAIGLADVYINVILWHYSLPKLMAGAQSLPPSFDFCFAILLALSRSS